MAILKTVSQVPIKLTAADNTGLTNGEYLLQNQSGFPLHILEQATDDPAPDPSSDTLAYMTIGGRPDAGGGFPVWKLKKETNKDFWCWIPFGNDGRIVYEAV